MNALFKPASYQTGAAWAVGATFVWKIISFANALLVAAIFGATLRSDIYFYLIMFIGIGLTFLQRLNNVVLIPEAMFLQEQNPQHAQRFLTMWLYSYAGLGLILVAVGIVWPVGMWEIFSRFDHAYLITQRTLLAAGFVLFALYILAYYLQAISEMYKFFGAAWLGILNAVFPFVFLLCFGRAIGLLSMVYGFIASNALQIIILAGVLKKQLNWSFKPAWTALGKRARHNALAGQTLAVMETINSWLPLFLISGIGAGLISALNYCRQLTDSPTEILTNRLTNVSKIALTELAAKNKQKAFNRTFLQTNFVLVFILAPLAVFTVYFAPEIVNLFFQRGEFDAQAATDTVRFLRPFIVTVLLLAPAMVQNAAVAAQRKIKENFPYAIISYVVFLAALLLFIPKYGAFMYAYLSLCGFFFGGYLNYLFFRKHLPFVSFIKMYEDLAKVTALNLAALVCAAAVANALPPLNSFCTILICGSIYIIGLLLASHESGFLKQFLKALRG